MAFARRNFLFGVLSLPASTLLAGRTLPGLTATVYNGYELHTVLQAAGAGSTIMLAPGNYGDIGSFILASSDISVRVQSPLRTILRSPLVVNGNFVDLEGLAFEAGVHLVGDGLKLNGSQFSGGSGVTITGVNTEVANCEFGNFTGRGVAIKGSASRPLIHNNYFHDSQGGGNGHEAIQIGQSTLDSSRTIGARVENNRIERCDAESEAISIKSCGNVISGNTLSDSAANITCRQGGNNTVQNNTLDRAYSIVCHGFNNRIIGNKAVNPRQKRNIRIMTGNVAANNTRQGGHPQALNTYVAGNNGILIIGDAFPGCNLPATNTTVAGHSGPVIIKNAIGTQTNGVPVSKQEPKKNKKKTNSEPIEAVETAAL